MRIKSNNFLKPINKSISFVNNCLYAKEGPNCAGKINLSSLNINYDSFFSANMTLQPEDKDMPIMYGFLGSEITFISIIAHYNNNPQVCPEENIIEYFFEDQPLIRRTFSDILVLTGTDTHRIPQIYVYNPGKEVVNLEIMVANLDVNTISTQLNPEYTEINGLSFNCIITDQIYGTNCTGSTQFEILDPLTISGSTGTTQMIIPFAKIDIMKIENSTIIIKTTADEPIKLNFVSKFNAEQAFSKMNWVIEDTVNRYITTSYPIIDIFGPVITFINNPVMISLPISKSEINRRYIQSVIDYDNSAATNIRDGIINNDNVEIIIINSSGEQLDEIIKDGNYTITFRISDLAGNTTSESKPLLVDSTGPTIYFKNPNNQMDLSSSTQTPGTIEDNDIIRYYIDHVWDDVDGLISNSAITTIVMSGGTPLSNPITHIGDYNLSFIVSDQFGNQTTENKQLTVVDSSYPVIHYNSVFYGMNNSAFTMSLSSNTATPISGITADDIRIYALSSVTDDYDGIINVSNVIITSTPTSLPIHNVGNYTITFEVSDASHNITTENKNLTVIT